MENVTPMTQSPGIFWILALILRDLFTALFNKIIFMNLSGKWHIIIIIFFIICIPVMPAEVTKRHSTHYLNTNTGPKLTKCSQKELN